MGVTTSNWEPTQVGLSVVRGQGLTWSQRVRMYNSYVSGNAETLSISSDDSIWDSDSEEEREQKSQEVTQPSQRSYNEHEEHSYFSSVPLAEKCHQLSNRKRALDDSGDEASGEVSPSPTKRNKVHCRAGDRFMRCIHHVHPGNVFQNGSTAKEEVKISPWQKSDDDNSVLDSSSSAASSDDDETYSPNPDEGFYRTKGQKTEDGDDDFPSNLYLREYTRGKTNTRLRGEKSPDQASSGPAKYKSAILHRYLCASTEEAPSQTLKRTHSSQRDLAKFEQTVLENKATGKRKRCESTDLADCKRPKSICDSSFSTKERQYSELEAAEVLTNLSRSSNIYKHLYTKKPEF